MVLRTVIFRPEAAELQLEILTAGIITVTAVQHSCSIGLLQRACELLHCTLLLC